MAKQGRTKKQRLCRICKKRPPWRYKNCPPGICKRCYHQHVWIDRPKIRAARAAASVDGSLPDTLEDGDVTGWALI